MVTTPSLRANKDYSLFTPFSKSTEKSVISSSVSHPPGNGSAHHLMHVNANKTPILTLNGLKPTKWQMQHSNDKNCQVSGGLQGSAMLALTSVTLLN